MDSKIIYLANEWGGWLCNCDLHRQPKPNPVLIERRYSANQSFVAAVCDCRVE